MRHTITICTALLITGLLLASCGGEPENQAEDRTDQSAAPAAVETLAMIVEVSEPTYWRDGEEVNTIDDVRAIVLGMDYGRDAQHTRNVDETYGRAGQLRVVFQPKPDARFDEDLKAVSDECFEQLKQAFDQLAEAAGLQEEAHLRSEVNAASEKVKKLQSELRDLQGLRRGLPSTDESRLDMRKLNRQIDNALAEQIALEKAVEQAERRNDRKRYVMLLRVR